MNLRHRLLPIAGCIALLLSGCGKTKEATLSYNEKAAVGIPSSVVSSDTDYTLLWDEENKCVLLKNIATDYVWSTIPYEYLLSDGSSANVRSPINITVSDNDTLKASTVRGSSGVISSGRVIAENIKNGIRVTYYFDKQKISIPVSYKLDNGQLVISLESKNIVEAANYKLLDVSIAPFLCAAKNSKENYLFVPSNSGELMYTNADTGGTRKFSGAVYGADMAHLLPTPQEYLSEIKLPVFAAKDGQEALFAIIESGAEHVTLEAEAGNNRTKWSAIWPKITVRGVDVISTRLPQATSEDIPYVSETRIEDDVVIRYIPLSGESADYNGMARCYREYLLKSGDLTNESGQIPSYSVTVYGGAQVKKLILGIPHDTTVKLTGFQETRQLLEILANDIGEAPVVQLIGYGKNGINIGQVGGGFDFAASLGSNRDLKDLLSFFEKNKIRYYFDYDILRYNKSSSGFSAVSDMAKTASLHMASLNTVDVALGGYTDLKYHLLSRKKLYDATDKLIRSVRKKNITGVSLNSLGKYSYSDYTDASYVAKGDYRKQMAEMVGEIRKNGVSFAASNSNLYASLLADSIFDFTLDSDFRAMNQSIPFYQMLFSGTKAMYSVPVNTSNNPKRQLMLSAAYGLGLNFEVIGEYDVNTDLNGYSFYGAVFDEQKEAIGNYAREYLDTFAKIRGAAICEYSMINSQISKTVYSNGTVVYANHSDKDAAASDISLQGFEYRVISQ